MKRVELSVYESGDGLIQVAIEDINGGGYRISGPKFDGTGRLLQRKALDERDVKEIRSYLDRVFPPPAPAPVDPREVVQQCVAIATSTGDVELTRTLGEEFPSDRLREGLVTACMMFAAMADLACGYMEKEDGSPVSREDVLSRVAIFAEEWF